MPFQKGISGNPRGRPKNDSFSQAIRLYLSRRNPDDPNDRSYRECVIQQLVAAALDGDISAIKEIIDRTEGKASQSLTLSGDQDKPFRFVIQRVTDMALEESNER